MPFALGYVIGPRLAPHVSAIAFPRSSRAVCSAVLSG
jgi:hypothetical protein